MNPPNQGHAPKFLLLPVQIIETSLGLILKRGCLQLKIQGKGAAAAVRRLVPLASSHAQPLDTLVAYFDQPEQPHIERLLHLLIAKNLLVSVEEKPALKTRQLEAPLDVFYWHFGETTEGVTERLHRMTLAIVGVNLLSRQLMQSLHASGLTNLKIVDHPLLRNASLLDNKGKMRKLEEEKEDLGIPMNLKEWEAYRNSSSSMTMVVTSEFGLTPLFHDLNSHCVENNFHFFPVWLEDMIGYVGPLVIPGESACFHCARARMNSHADDPRTQDLIDRADWSETPTVGFHPAMIAMLGNLAAFELTKFYSSLFSNSILGRMVEISLLGPRLKSRKIFKIPRCLVCSPLRTTPSITPKLDVCMEPK